MIKQQIILYYDEKAVNEVSVCSKTVQNVYKLSCRHQCDFENPEYRISIDLIGERWMLVRTDSSDLNEERSNGQSQNFFSMNSQPMQFTQDSFTDSQLVCEADLESQVTTTLYRLQAILGTFYCNKSALLDHLEDINSFCDELEKEIREDPQMRPQKMKKASSSQTKSMKARI